MTINVDEAEKSVRWLLANARAIGLARYNLVKAERMVDRTKAIEMKRHSDLAVAAQEREAKASKAMEEAYTNEAVAAGRFEELRAERDAHVALLELFRTMESSARQLAKEATHGGPQHYDNPNPRDARRR